MRAAYSTYADRFAGSRLPPMDADYAAEIRDYPVWVVDLQGTIIGGLIMSFEGECATLANVAVHPGFHGQGVGGCLMRFAEATARQRGCARIRLATHVLLTENLALYRHLGWSETDRDHLQKSL